MNGYAFTVRAPIKLLSYSEKSENEKFDQILLNPEALNILQKINDPLAIISVVGSFRRGQSWFANLLHGRHDGFNIGPGVEGSCTRGIYTIWSPLFKLSNEQSDVISSTFVYNIYGIVAAMVIERIFNDFDVYSLPLPGCKKKTITHMEEVKNDKLDEDFVNEFRSSFLLSIPSKYESVIQFVAQEAIKESIEKYKERMNALINEGGKLPILWKKFKKIHLECFSEVNITFFKNIIGSPTQISNFTEQLGKEMCKFKEELANIEDLQYALKFFKSNYNKSMKKSPEADKVITSYKTNQCSAAIDYMARFGRINKELANTMNTREEAYRKQLEASAHEIKMLELQANIRQQKQLHQEEEKRSNKIKENLWVCI
ncbi:hypothetical protein C1646_769375 [Rhizophagus diaphanus]|nr:hypothetical protein C1646_769375 [Rhizophagus diaphanus] [Rhizophagus sp. MUCL 43196]